MADWDPVVAHDLFMAELAERRRKMSIREKVEEMGRHVYGVASRMAEVENMAVVTLVVSGEDFSLECHGLDAPTLDRLLYSALREVRARQVDALGIEAPKVETPVETVDLVTEALDTVFIDPGTPKAEDA